jgi:membrane fusion protein (multidrug efflux system)
MIIKPQRLVLTTELPGRTAAYRVADITPRVSGLILKRLFREGSNVHAGELLYQIDPGPFEAALENAQASLSRAEANLTSLQLRLNRFKELLPDKAVSQQEYDDALSAANQAKAEIESWKAQVKTARINLAYTRITAPISGRIGRSSVTEGAVVSAFQPVALATIQQINPVYVDVPQSTSDLLRLKKLWKSGNLNQNGAGRKKVGLLLDDDTEYQHGGILQFRDVTVDPTTGSVILRIVFPNPQDVLLPGMFVRAVVREGVNPKALLIPQQAVSRDQKGNPLTLIVDKDNKVQQRMLKLERAIGDSWIVLSGIEPGERVIVEGMQKIRPGAAVKIAPFETVESGDENKNIKQKNKTPQPGKSK